MLKLYKIVCRRFLLCKIMESITHIINNLNDENILWNIIILVILIDPSSFVLHPFVLRSFALRSLVLYSFFLRTFITFPLSPALIWRGNYVGALSSCALLLLHPPFMYMLFKILLLRTNLPYTQSLATHNRSLKMVWMR